MGGSSVPSNTTNTTTTVTQAPAYVQPYATGMMQKAGELANRPYQAYPGQQIAPLNANDYAGLNLITNRAQNTPGVLTAANNSLTNTLNGGNNFVASNPLAGVDNPYLQQVINNSNADITRNYQQAVQPQTDANFARAGAFGGSAWQNANDQNQLQLANSLAKNTSNLRYGDYTNQQQLAEDQANRAQQAYGLQTSQQLQAAPIAQQLADQPYTDAQKLLGAGDVLQNAQQTQLNQQYQNWLNAQNWPLQNMDILQNALRTTMGGGGSSIQTAQMPSLNPAASMVGGGIAGAALGNALGYGTLGTVGGGLAGAALGGILG